MIRYHHPEAQRIFELPIYRCTEEQHYKEQEASFELAAQWTKEALRILNKGPEFDAEEMKRFRRDWFEREARPWDFNQIVGWIRLYAWRGNIAAYLFFVADRRKIWCASGFSQNVQSFWKCEYSKVNLALKYSGG
jgi:hypothetical protein